MLKISEMSGKLSGVQAINTNTLANEFCKKQHKVKKSICSDCYSFQMLETFRANCAPAWQRNSDLLSAGLIPPEYLPTINAHTFRLHGHGELINAVHYLNFIRIAKKNPACTFTLWTKRKNIIAAAARSIDPAAHRPINLILMYSNPATDRVMTVPPKYFDKVFNVTERKNHKDNCTGRKCIDCRQCYSLDSGVNSIIELLK
tara:strand:+ start:8 stop:613 length:606 start_codon:yes stop_codon:yes gene_type:complete